MKIPHLGSFDMKKHLLNLTGVAVVLELPEPVRSKIQKIREHFSSELADAVPPEITITGSSGLGDLTPGQDPVFVIRELKKIAALTPAFKAIFGEVFQYPDSTVYALKVEPVSRFQELHQRLAESQIAFQPSPHPFFPHCSLHIWGELTAAQQQEIFQVRLTEEFIIRTMALYQLVDTKAVALVERFKLGGMKKF